MLDGPFCCEATLMLRKAIKMTQAALNCLGTEQRLNAIAGIAFLLSMHRKAASGPPPTSWHGTWVQ